MDDGLVADEVEIQIGRSPLSVGLVLALLVGLGVVASVALGGGSPKEAGPVVGDELASDEAITTHEQMAIDHSDGIALEVVGDELWILGSGIGNPVKSEPFSIYVTGTEGELLRTIDVGRHFNEMGQSDSYVWLLADGTTQELVERPPELLQISKETGEIVRMRWGYIYGEVTAAEFTDVGLWASSADKLTRYWATTRGLVSSSSRLDTGQGQLAIDNDIIYFESFGVLSRSDEYGGHGFANSRSEFPSVDMVFSGDTLWTLDESGIISVVGPDLEKIQRGRCIGATHLAATPINSGVIASAGFDHCLIDLDTSSHTTLEPGHWPVADTAYFADQLWLATPYISDRISVPIEKLAKGLTLRQMGADQRLTNLAMYYDRSDGIAMEVVGDELWILGGGSEAAGIDAKYKIYITESSGELLRSIDVGGRFDVMGQSDLYVWLISYGVIMNPPEENGELVRISKQSGIIERIAQNFTPRPVVAFTDEGFLWESGAGGGVQLNFWEMFPGVAVRVAALPERYRSSEMPAIVSITVNGDSVFLGMQDGWLYRLSTDGEFLSEMRLESDWPVLDLSADDRLLWVIQDGGWIRVLDLEFAAIKEWRCEGASRLIDLPGTNVLASTNYDYCLVGVVGPSELTRIPSKLPAAGASDYFAGQLWYANSYLDTHFSDSLGYGFWYDSASSLDFGGDNGSASTHEQMRLDHSDAIALEIVGDELWILGGGSTETDDDGPFRTYVTGPDGELLRTIEFDQRFETMGQSESYVWFLAHATDASEADGRMVRISKQSGNWWDAPHDIEPGSVVAFTDDGFLWESRGADGEVQLMFWGISSIVAREALELPERYRDFETPVIGSIVLDGESVFIGTVDGWLLQGSLEGGELTGDLLQPFESPVIDMLLGDESLWVLQENGLVIAIGDDPQAIRERSCVGATHLAALPGGGVVAVNGFDTCLVQLDGPSVSATLLPGFWPVLDSVVFAGQLWGATTFDADHLSIPIESEVVAD